MHLLSRKKNKSKFSPLRKIEKTENNRAETKYELIKRVKSMIGKKKGRYALRRKVKYLKFFFGM